MMQHLVSLVAGVVFGLGLAVAEMTNPLKVLDFLDLAGHWDPSLAFVMGGALAVAIPGYRLVLARKAPRFEPKFQLPDTKLIDMKLVAGSGLFGIGWGIAGFCPGGALPALGTLRPEALAFVASMILGLFIARGLKALAARSPQSA